MKAIKLIAVEAVLVAIATCPSPSSASESSPLSYQVLLQNAEEYFAGTTLLIDIDRHRSEIPKMGISETVKQTEDSERELNRYTQIGIQNWTKEQEERATLLTARYLESLQRRERAAACIQNNSYGSPLEQCLRTPTVVQCFDSAYVAHPLTLPEAERAVRACVEDYRGSRRSR